MIDNDVITNNNIKLEWALCIRGSIMVVWTTSAPINTGSGDIMLQNTVSHINQVITRDDNESSKIIIV
jgi:hypothetical protein